MKLELKHVAGYLPYGVKIKTGNVVREMVCDRNINDEEAFKIKVPIFNVITGIGHKLMLRPLSNLTKKIEINREKFVPIEKIYNSMGWELDELPELIERGDILGIYSDEDIIPYSHALMLLEWHFDIYGLIEKGLAISIHDFE